MEVLIKTLVCLVALEHFYFMYFEMFAWETIGKRTFRSLAPEIFKPTKVLAANQGLYNGFIAAGLIWSLLISDEKWQWNIALFFLSCVAIAGIYAAFTASKKVFYIQAMPAILTIILMLL